MIAALSFPLTSIGALLTRYRLPDKPPSIKFPEKPALITVKKGEGKETEIASLQTLVETRCQSLFAPFHPLWWLFNGHLQTIYSVLGDFTKDDQMWYARKYLRLGDGGTLGLDFSPPDDSGLKDDTPIIVVMHGLTGGSYESYVRAILHRACAPTEKGGLGYRAVVVNFRGCAGVPITSPQLYSAGYTDDLRQAVKFISYTYPSAPLLGVGFSLGANVITRYLSEEGQKSRLLSGCALGCPWNLDLNNRGLENSIIGRNVYSRGMGSNLQRLLKRHCESLQSTPEHFVAKAVPLALALRRPTLDQFDNTFTCVAGGSPPIFPFPTAQEYYRWASSHHVLPDIRVPYIAINAEDDPVVRHIPADGGGNGFVIMGMTPSGGHLGWFQAGDGVVERWTTKPVLEWLKLTGGDIVPDAKTRRRRIYMGDDGWLREEGTPHLTCRQIEGGGLIDGNRGEGGVLGEGGMLQGL